MKQLVMLKKVSTMMIQIDCQEVLEELENKDTKAALKQFEYFLELNL